MNTTGTLGMWNSRCKETVGAWGEKMSAGYQPPGKKEEYLWETEEGSPRDKSRQEKVRGVQLEWKSSF